MNTFIPVHSVMSVHPLVRVVFLLVLSFASFRVVQLAINCYHEFNICGAKITLSFGTVTFCVVFANIGLKMTDSAVWMAEISRPNCVK